MSNYFDIPAVSNSKLTELKLQLAGRDFMDLTEAFYFGSLFDAVTTEPYRIDPFLKTLDGIPVDIGKYELAKKMAKVLRANETVKDILSKNAQMQKVSIKDRELDWNGVKFDMRCKCKWDFFGAISGDIKTTAATTQKGFEDACEYLDYYRSRAWYMDIEGTNKDLIIGISKKNLKIFFLPIRRGDKYYEKGLSQYLDLAMRYWVLKM